MDTISRNGEFVCAFSTAFDHQRAQWEEIVYSENGLPVFSSVLQESATGTGKSVTIAALAAHFGRIGVTTLILTNRQELVKSLYLTTRAAAEKVSCEIGLIWSDAGRGSASDDDEAAAIGEGIAVGWSAPIIVASVQTLARRPEMPPIGLVITDECHHEEADMWEGIYARVEAGNPDWKHVGFSATPYRTKNGRPVGLGGRFESYLTNTAFPYAAAVEAAVIVPLVGIKKTWLLTDAPADLEVKGDDYVVTRQAVIDQLTTPGAIDQVLGDLREDREQHGRVLRTLGFCCNRRHAEVMADKATGKGFRAAYVVGNSPGRAETIRRWRAGDIDVLFSADLFLEGFDAPEVEMIVKLRPCRSIGRGMQMFGRGTRPDPSLRLSEIPTVEGRRAAIAGSRKPSCLVRDYAHNPDVTPFGPDEVIQPEKRKATTLPVDVPLPEADVNGTAATTGRPDIKEGDDTPLRSWGSGNDAVVMPIAVGDIVENTANPQFGPGVVTAIEGNAVSVDWANEGSTKQPKNNVTRFRVVGTEEEDAWRRESDPVGFALARMLEYSNNHAGSTLVPIRYVTPDGFQLGARIQRARLNKKDPLLKLCRGIPGWVDDVFEAQWEEAMSYCDGFFRDRGYAPRKSSTDPQERRAAQWMGDQRTALRKGKLMPHRLSKLTATTWWDPSPSSAPRTHVGIENIRASRKASLAHARAYRLLHTLEILSAEWAECEIRADAPHVMRACSDGLLERRKRWHRDALWRLTPAGEAELARLRAELADESEAAK